MKLNFTVAESTTKYLEANLEEATHFRYNGDTYPLHAIVDRTIASSKIHARFLSCYGTEYLLDECTQLKAVVSTTPTLYKIELTEGEAEVLAEVLRHTRVGANPHKDVTAVCNELWGKLPAHSVSNATVVTGPPLHVRKSA